MCLILSSGPHDTPGVEASVDQSVQGVLNEICESFDFYDEDRSA